MKYLKLNIKDDGLNTRKTFQQAQNSKQQNFKKKYVQVEHQRVQLIMKS